MQDGLLPLDDDRVARVVSALKPRDEFGLRGVIVDYFSFAFISPLNSDNHDTLRHISLLQFDLLYGKHSLGFPQLLERLWIRFRIDVDQRDGFLFLLVPTEVHAGDVNSLCGDDRAHGCDNAWLIDVACAKKVAVGDGVDQEIVDLNKPWLPAFQR